MSLIIISPFPGIFSWDRSASGIQEAKVFLNGRQKHMDNYDMLAKVLLFTNVLKAVCDVLNEIADLLIIMFFVLQVRMTVSRHQDP